MELRATNSAKALSFVFPDQLPQVAIVDPEPLVAAVEGWKVPVTVQAVDDVGIDRIVLFAGVNGWGPDPTPLKLEATQPTAVQGHYTFDLAKLGARAATSSPITPRPTITIPAGPISPTRRLR
jgi:hypothetical protein